MHLASALQRYRKYPALHPAVREKQVVMIPAPNEQRLGAVQEDRSMVCFFPEARCNRSWPEMAAGQWGFVGLARVCSRVTTHYRGADVEAGFVTALKYPKPTTPRHWRRRPPWSS